MRRLLCIVGKMDAGGSETFLMKIYRSLDKTKYQMDFCVSSIDEGFYDKEIKNLGGKIYRSIPKSKAPIKSFISIYNIVKKNNYQYVMRSSQNAISSLELLAAKFAGAKVRVFRSTNSKTMKGGYENIIHILFKPLVKMIANVKLAPSKPAAKFMFGNNKHVIFLNNGIPLNDFVYDDKYNKKMRKILNIDNNTFVIGHIGRFNNQKNHKKIVNIFYEILKKNKNSKLVLVGKGELEDNIKKQIKSLDIQNKVILLGTQNNINKLLSLFDLFLFPSLYEGMPNVVVEAQANGVPCIISNTITKEIKICDNIYMSDLNLDDEKWCDICLSHKTRYKDNRNIFLLDKNGYNINDVKDLFIKSVFYKK